MYNNILYMFWFQVLPVRGYPPPIAHGMVSPWRAGPTHCVMMATGSWADITKYAAPRHIRQETACIIHHISPDIPSRLKADHTWKSRFLQSAERSIPQGGRG